MTRKITRGLANIAHGLGDCLNMGNFDALRGWGHPKDYVRTQWMMLQQETPQDFVIATGAQYSVREFIQRAAEDIGITLAFHSSGLEEHTVVLAMQGDKAHALRPGQTIPRIDQRYFPTAEVDTLLGDPTHARERLG